MIRFGFYKKNNQTEFFLKKKPNRNRFKLTGFDSVRFFRTKPIQTGLAWFFWLGSIFRFDSGFFSVWVWFDFFDFRLIKPNRTDLFFQNFNQFNRFFYGLVFFVFFFSGFLDLIGFLIFLLTPS